tara:strand:+ start:1061 stop:1354 length:294 start_codon:yes stop_codon:yes gene_type:complete
MSKKKPQTKYLEYKDMVIVKWLDHVADSSWLEKHTIDSYEPIEVQTIGFLVEEDKDCYKVVDSLTSDGGVGGFNLILKSCVTEITHFEFAGQTETRH